MQSQRAKQYCKYEQNTVPQLHESQFHLQKILFQRKVISALNSEQNPKKITALSRSQYVHPNIQSPVFRRKFRDSPKWSTEIIEAILVVSTRNENDSTQCPTERSTTAPKSQQYGLKTPRNRLKLNTESLKRSAKR